MVEIIPILGEVATSVEPGDGVLDNPALGSTTKPLMVAERFTISISRFGMAIATLPWKIGPV